MINRKQLIDNRKNLPTPEIKFSMIQKNILKLLILLLLPLLAMGGGIVVLVFINSTSPIRTIPDFSKQFQLLWQTATTNFSSELLKEILLLVVTTLGATIIGIFNKKILSILSYLFTSEQQKLALRDLEALETAYLDDLKQRIDNETDKLDRWDINRYVDMEVVSGEDVEPELREFRVRISKVPIQSTDAKTEYYIYGEPSSKSGSDIGDYLKNERCILIKGEPGSGKTITLRRIAKSSLDQSLKNPQAPLPILIELSHYRQTDPITKEPIEIIDFLKNYLGQIHPDSSFLSADLEKSLQRRSFLFIFDGLNEMPPEDYNERVRKIAEFSKLRRKHRFVFACRTLHYDPLLEAKTLTIMPLDNSRIRLFLHKYIENSSQAEKIFDELEKAPSQVVDACRTPLILFMLSRAQIYQPNLGIPNDPVSIFDGFVHQLYVDNNIPIDQREKLSDALNSLAFKMISNGMISASVNDEWLSKNISSNNLSLIKGHGKSSGILDYSIAHGYKFSHHMLQEYFAGCALAQLYNAEKEINKYLDAYWWEEVIISASAMVNSPNDFLMGILGGDKSNIFNDSLQTTILSTGGESNIGVIKYLYQRSQKESTYKYHIGASIAELYKRIFTVGRSRIQNLESHARRLLLCARITGAIKERLSAQSIDTIVDNLEIYLLFGDIYQRAGVIEICRYLPDTEGVALLSWLVNYFNDRTSLREFQVRNLDNFGETLFSFFSGLRSQLRLPILDGRRWLRELAFSTLASLDNEHARGEIAKALLKDPTTWILIRGILPTVDFTDIVSIIRYVLLDKRIRYFLSWLMFMIFAVVLAAFIGISNILDFLAKIWLYVVGVGTVIYIIYAAVKVITAIIKFLFKLNHKYENNLSQNENNPVRNEMPRVSFSRNDLFSLFKTIAYVSLGILGVGAILFIGLFPMVIMIIYFLALLTLIPILKTYWNFIRNKRERDELTSRIFTSAMRRPLLNWSLYYIVSIMVLVFTLTRSRTITLLLPQWSWGVVGGWLIKLMGVSVDSVVLFFGWILLVLVLFYSPPVIYVIYTIVGSYLQILDIQRLENSLRSNLSEQNYQQIDSRLAKIAQDQNRWNVARSRAIQALGNSPNALVYQPLFEQLSDVKDGSEVVQEAAEKAIYDIKRRQSKYQASIKYLLNKDN